MSNGATFNTAAINSDARYICAGTNIIKNKRKKNRAAPGPKPKRSRLDQSAINEDADEESGSESSPSAYILCWDTRSMARPLLHLDDVHSDEINHVVFKRDSSELLSASDDCLVCLTNINAPKDDRLIDVSYRWLLNRLHDFLVHILESKSCFHL